jgi:hypothetical protein
MTDTFPNPLFYLDIQRYYPGCNSAFVSLAGKDLENIAGKTNDETGESGETDLFNMYAADLFEYNGMKTVVSLPGWISIKNFPCKSIMTAPG